MFALWDTTFTCHVPVVQSVGKEAAVCTISTSFAIEMKKHVMEGAGFAEKKKGEYYSYGK